jgi:hypothetical protein
MGENLIEKKKKQRAMSLGEKASAFKGGASLRAAVPG